MLSFLSSLITSSKPSTSLYFDTKSNTSSKYSSIFFKNEVVAFPQVKQPARTLALIIASNPSSPPIASNAFLLLKNSATLFITFESLANLEASLRAFLTRLSAFSKSSLVTFSAVSSAISSAVCANLAFVSPPIGAVLPLNSSSATSSDTSSNLSVLFTNTRTLYKPLSNRSATLPVAFLKTISSLPEAFFI